jgi:hypothetical protein
LRRPEEGWDTKDTVPKAEPSSKQEIRKVTRGSIPGQANGAAGISKSPSVWSESVLTSLWHTVSSLSLIYMPRLDVWNRNQAMPIELRDPVCCGVANMLGAEMRLARALREQRQCYRTSMVCAFESVLRFETGFPFTSIDSTREDDEDRRFREINHDTEMAMRRRLFMSNGDNE